MLTTEVVADSGLSLTTATVLSGFQSLAPAPRLVPVLHIINGEHFSGAERVQQLLGNQLPQFGFDAHFACVKAGKFKSLSDLPDDRVSTFPMHGRWDWRVVQALTARVERDNVALLHAHTPRTALVTSLVALKTGRPWVYHVHSPTARDSTRSLVNRFNSIAERWALRHCDSLITVSRSLRREMLHRGVHRSRLRVVPNGVPAFEAIRPAERLQQSQWRLGLIALMRPRKGVEVALEAMRMLKQTRPDVTLELIGGFESESYGAQIRELIERWELQDTVRYSGFTTDIASAMRRLDVLILPSLFGEGMPMVVLEALAAAVPVIATRVEGTPEAVRDSNEGLLAAPGDPASLSQAILQLTRSRETWAAMSQRALARHREHFTDTRMAERVAKAYRQLLDRTTP